MFKNSRFFSKQKRNLAKLLIVSMLVSNFNITTTKADNMELIELSQGLNNLDYNLTEDILENSEIITYESNTENTAIENLLEENTNNLDEDLDLNEDLGLDKDLDESVLYEEDEDNVIEDETSENTGELFEISLPNCDFEILIDLGEDLESQLDEDSNLDYSDYVTLDESQYPAVLTLHSDKPITLSNKDGVFVSNQRIIIDGTKEIYLNGVSIYSDGLFENSILEIKNDTIIIVNPDTFNQFEIGEGAIIETITGLENAIFDGVGTLTIFYHNNLDEDSKNCYLAMADEYNQISLRAIGKKDIEDDFVNKENEQQEKNEMESDIENEENNQNVLLPQIDFENIDEYFNEPNLISGGVGESVLVGCEFNVTVTLADGTVLGEYDSAFSNHITYTNSTKTVAIHTSDIVTFSNKNDFADTTSIANHRIVVNSNITDGANIVFDGVYLTRTTTGTYNLLTLNSPTTLTVNKKAYTGTANVYNADSVFRVYSNGKSNNTILNAENLTIKGDGKIAIFSHEGDYYDYTQLGDNVIDYKLTDTSPFGTSPSGYIGVVKYGTSSAADEYLAEDFDYDSTTTTLTIKSSNIFRIRTSTLITKIVVAEGISPAPTIIFDAASLSFSRPANSTDPIFDIKSNTNLLLKGKLYLTNTNDDMSVNLVQDTSGNDSKLTIQNGNSDFFDGIGEFDKPFIYFNTYTFNDNTTNSLSMSLSNDSEVDEYLLIDNDDYISYTYFLNIKSNRDTMNFEVTVLDQDEIKNIKTSTAPYDIFYDAGTLHVNTDVKLNIKTLNGSSSAMQTLAINIGDDESVSNKIAGKTDGAELTDMTGKTANIVLDGFYNNQQSAQPCITFNADTNLEISGENIIQINPDKYNSTGVEGASIIGNPERIKTITGAGTLDIKPISNSNLDNVEKIEEAINNVIEAGGDVFNKDNIQIYIMALHLSDCEYSFRITDDSTTARNESYLTYDQVEFDTATKTLYIKTTNEFVVSNGGTTYSDHNIIVDLGDDASDNDKANLTINGLTRSTENLVANGELNGSIFYFKSPTNLKFSSGSKNIFYSPDDDSTIPVIRTEAPIHFSGAGEIELFSNVGSSLIHVVNDADVDWNANPASSDITVDTKATTKVNFYTYSNHSAVEESDFMVADLVETDMVATIMYINPLEPSEEPFSEEQVTYKKFENGSGRLIFNDSDHYVYIKNKTTSATTDLLGVSENMSGSKDTIDLIFAGVNIKLDVEDEQSPPVPILTISDNTNIHLWDNTNNYLQVPYDAADNTQIPTIAIENDALLNIYEGSNTLLKITTRRNADAISGNYVQDTSGDSSATVLQQVNITAGSSETLASGDVTFDGDTITVNTSKMIQLSNADPNMPSEISILVKEGIEGEANIILKDYNVYHTGRNVIVIDIQSDTNLYIDGINQVRGVIGTGQPVVRVGTQNGTSATLTIREHNSSSTTDKLYLSTRLLGPGIEVTNKSSLYIKSGNIYVENNGAPAIGAYNDTYGHGKIYIEGGNIDLEVSSNSTSYTTLGGAKRGGYTYVTGGNLNFINTNYYDRILVGVVSGGVTHSFLLQDSAVMTIARNTSSTDHNLNSSNGYGTLKTLYNFSNKAQSQDWTGILGTVSAGSGSNTAGYYTVYGRVNLTEPFTMSSNKQLNFNTYNNVESWLNVNSTLFTNNGTITRNATYDANPNMDGMPYGSGTVTVALTNDLIQAVATEEGAENTNGYRGNSIFDYYHIKENGENLLDKVDIIVSKKNASETYVPLTGHTMDGIGEYKLEVKANSNAISYGEGKNKLLYTGSLSEKAFQVTAADLKDSTITFKEFTYRGKNNPFTEKELIDGMTLLLNSKYLTRKTEDVTIADYEATITDSNKDNILAYGYTGPIEVTAESPEEDEFVAIYTGSNTIAKTDDNALEIKPRSINDPAISIAGVVDKLLDTDDNNENKQSLTVKYSYTINGTTDKDEDELIEDTDYKVTYQYVENETIRTGSDKLEEVGQVKMTIEGIGNFEGTYEQTYYLQGDLSDKDDTKITVTLTDGKLPISVGGRPDNSDIKVEFNDNTLEYGVDYMLDFKLDTNLSGEYALGAILITVRGLGLYTDFQKTDASYAGDGRVEIITEPVYLKPDGDINAEEINIRVYWSGDGSGDLSELDSEDFTLVKVGQYGSNDETIVKLKLLIIGDTGTAEKPFFEAEFELLPVQAGSGTYNDFAKATIYLVDKIYERPDKSLHVLDDLFIEVNQYNDSTKEGEKVTLVKDDDYTIDIAVTDENDDITAVIVKATETSGYTGEVTFNITTSEAGTGTGNNLGKGIIKHMTSVSIVGEGVNTEIEDEIKKNLKVYNYNNVLLEEGQHYEATIGLDRNSDDTVVSSNVTVELNGIEGGSLVGTTKEFNIILESVSGFIDSDDLYFKPDYTLDLSKLKLIHPGYPDGDVYLEYGIDYTNIQEYWTSISSSSDENRFAGVLVTFTDTFLIDYPQFKTHGSNLYGDGNTFPFSATAGEAGTGSKFDTGLIDYATVVYKRPDGEFNSEDLRLTINNGTLFTCCEDYEIVTYKSFEPIETEHPSGNSDISSIVSSYNTTITIEGADATNTSTLDGNNIYPYAGQSVTFNMYLGEAGAGYGTNFTGGIVHNAKTLYKRPDDLYYFDDDFIVEVNDGNADINVRNKLNLDTDYTVSAYPNKYSPTHVTITGKGVYDGTINYSIKTANAGSNTSSKSFAEGIIPVVQNIYQKSYPETSTIDEAVIEGLKESLQYNDGTGLFVDLELDIDYTIEEISDISTGIEMVSDSESVSENSSTSYRQVYIKAKDGNTKGFTGETNFRVTVDLDNTRFDITDDRITIEQLKDTKVYQKPDGIYTYSEDLKLTMVVPFIASDIPGMNGLTSFTLNYPEHFSIVKQDNETDLYTVYGRGIYTGLKKDVTIDIIDAGEGTGYSLRESIIHLIEPTYVLERNSSIIDFSKLELKVWENNTNLIYGVDYTVEEFNEDYDFVEDENVDINKDYIYKAIKLTGTGAEPTSTISEELKDSSASYISNSSYYGSVIFGLKVENYIPDVPSPSPSPSPSEPPATEEDEGEEKDEDEDDAPTTTPPTTTTPNGGSTGGNGSSSSGNSSSGSSNNKNDSSTNTTTNEVTEINKTNEINDTNTEWINPFVDVLENSWYYEDVKTMYENGLMKGISEDTFDPNSTTTRAMMVQILYNLEGNPETEITNQFSDVSANNWYYDAIGWAKQFGIITGITEELFAPNQNITREQLVAILHRYTILKEIDNDIRKDVESFYDYLHISEYALENMKWAVGNELIYGNDKNLLLPNDFAKRSEITAIMNRYYSNYLSEFAVN